MKEHGVLEVSIKASNLYVRFNCGLRGRSTKDDGFEACIEGIGKICSQCRDKGSESYIHSCLTKRSDLLQKESVRLMDLAKLYKIEWPTTAEHSHLTIKGKNREKKPPKITKIPVERCTKSKMKFVILLKPNGVNDGSMPS